MAFIYFFDKLSAEPKLNIKGKERYVTNIGAVMTILSYSLILSLAIYLFVKFVQGQGVNVVFYTKTGVEKYSMDLNKSPFLFKLQDQNSKEVNPRMLNITIGLNVLNLTDMSLKKINLKKQKFSTKLYNDSFSLAFLKKPEYKDYIPYYESFSVPVIENNNFSLIYDVYSISSSIVLTVNECQNSTSFNNCYPKADIKKYLEDNRIKLTYMIPAHFLYIFDYKHPLDESLIDRNIELKGDFEYTYNDKYKIIFFDSDAGLFLEDVISRTGYKYDTEFSDKSVALIKNDNPDYLKIILEINNLETDYYLRTYPKLQSLIAEVEGISNWVFYVTTFISIFFSEKPMNLEIFNNTIKVKKMKTQNVRQPRNDITVQIFKELKSDTSATVSNNYKSYNLDSSRKDVNSNRAPFRKKIKASYYEMIFPTCAIKNLNKRDLLEKAIKFNDKVLSVEKIVENVLDTHKLKTFLLDKTKIDFYDNIEIFNRNEPFLKFWLKKKGSEDEKIDYVEIYGKLEQSDDYMNQKLLSFFKQY
jgi:hypothetical protein